MQVSMEVYFVPTDEGGERLCYYAKTSCCGAKMYPHLVPVTRMCTLCGSPLEDGTTRTLPVRKSTRPLA